MGATGALAATLRSEQTDVSCTVNLVRFAYMQLLIRIETSKVNQPCLLVCCGCYGRRATKTHSKCIRNELRWSVHGNHITPMRNHRRYVRNQSILWEKKKWKMRLHRPYRNRNSLSFCRFRHKSFDFVNFNRIESLTCTHVRCALHRRCPGGQEKVVSNTIDLQNTWDAVETWDDTNECNVAHTPLIQSDSYFE